jgi:hypothetical protein
MACLLGSSVSVSVCVSSYDVQSLSHRPPTDTDTDTAAKGEGVGEGEDGRCVPRVDCREVK